MGTHRSYKKILTTMKRLGADISHEYYDLSTGKILGYKFAVFQQIYRTDTDYENRYVKPFYRTYCIIYDQTEGSTIWSQFYTSNQIKKWFMKKKLDKL